MCAAWHAKSSGRHGNPRRSCRNLSWRSSVVLLQRGDGIGHGHGCTRDFGVEQLDHAPIELDRTLALVLRQRERGDQLARGFHVLRGWREHGVARLDLAWVYERLAVKAKAPGLLARRLETIGVLDVVIDAIDDRDGVGARGEHAKPQRC